MGNVWTGNVGIHNNLRNNLRKGNLKMATNNNLNNGTVPLIPGYGGTGVANTGTITVGGNTAFSGAFTFAGTVTGNTTVTFPTSGTLATTASTMTWSNISGTTQAAAVNNGYVVGNASQTTVTLPVTAALGSVVQIQGKGAAGWILAAGTGQTIQVGQTATTTAGSVTSAAAFDTIQVVCVTANTTWATSYVLSSGVTVA